MGKSDDQSVWLEATRLKLEELLSEADARSFGMVAIRLDASINAIREAEIEVRTEKSTK